jgi:hypothetical protein
MGGVSSPRPNAADYLPPGEITAPSYRPAPISPSGKIPRSATQRNDSSNTSRVYGSKTIRPLGVLRADGLAELVIEAFRGEVALLLRDPRTSPWWLPSPVIRMVTEPGRFGDRVASSSWEPRWVLAVKSFVSACLDAWHRYGVAVLSNHSKW